MPSPPADWTQGKEVLMNIENIANKLAIARNNVMYEGQKKVLLKFNPKLDQEEEDFLYSLARQNGCLVEARSEDIFFGYVVTPVMKLDLELEYVALIENEFRKLVKSKNSFDDVKFEVPLSVRGVSDNRYVIYIQNLVKSYKWECERKFGHTHNIIFRIWVTQEVDLEEVYSKIMKEKPESTIVNIRKLYDPLKKGRDQLLADFLVPLEMGNWYIVTNGNIISVNKTQQRRFF